MNLNRVYKNLEIYSSILESYESEDNINKICNYIFNILNKKYKLLREDSHNLNIVNFYLTETFVINDICSELSIPRNFFGNSETFFSIKLDTEKTIHKGNFTSKSQSGLLITLFLYNIKREQELKSTLTHELKHMIEYLQFGKYSKTIDNDIDYYNIPSEYRARISEWFLKVKSLDKNKVRNTNILELIERYFNNFNKLNSLNKKKVIKVCTSLLSEYFNKNNITKKVNIKSRIKILENKYDCNISCDMISDKKSSIDNICLINNNDNKSLIPLLEELIKLSNTYKYVLCISNMIKDFNNYADEYNFTKRVYTKSDNRINNLINKDSIDNYDEIESNSNLYCFITEWFKIPNRY